MTCFTMYDRELMAFLVLADESKEYNSEDMEIYKEHLKDVIPTYVMFITGSNSIKDNCESFPDIFAYNARDNSFKSGEKYPNPEYFFRSYPDDVLKFIRNVTNRFVQVILQSERNKRMKARLLGVKMQ